MLKLHKSHKPTFNHSGVLFFFKTKTTTTMALHKIALLALAVGAALARPHKRPAAHKVAAPLPSNLTDYPGVFGIDISSPLSASFSQSDVRFRSHFFFPHLRILPAVAMHSRSGKLPICYYRGLAGRVRPEPGACHGCAWASFSFVHTKCSRQHTHTQVARAWAAGYQHVDVYAFMCNQCDGNGPGAVQELVQYLQSNQVTFGQIWCAMGMLASCNAPTSPHTGSTLSSVMAAGKTPIPTASGSRALSPSTSRCAF
jgi:hypothetical protein